MKLSLTGILCLCALAAGAADFTSGGLNYREWSDNTVIIMPKGDGENDAYSGVTNANLTNTVTYGGRTYTVVGIADGAFAKATFSDVLTLPTTVTTIGNYAFEAADGPGVVMAAATTELYEAAFAGNKFSQGITVDAANPAYASLTEADGENSSGALVTKDKRTLVNFPGGKTTQVLFWTRPLSSYTIPSSITAIGDFCFYMNSGLATITIPNTVTHIGRAAFYECTGLESITLPASVTSLGSSAFCGCVNVTSLTFNTRQLREIPGHAFFYLASLRTLTLPEGVERLGMMSFASCEALQNVNLSSTVAVLDTTCFLDDPITKIDLRNVRHIGRMAFSGCTELTAITGGEKLERIDNAAFTRCNKLTAVSLPSVRELPGNAFFRCTALRSLALPANVELMAGNPAVGCTALESITIADDCPHFRVIDGAVYATTGATVDGDAASAGGDNSTPTVLVAVPAAGNTVLNVPEGVTAIGVQACREVALTEVSLPKSLREVRNAGFSSVGTIESLTCLAAQPPVVVSAFADGTYAGALLTVPTRSLDAYRAAEGWAPFQHWATIDVGDDLQPGDLNGDGNIDVDDLNALVNVILELADGSDLPGTVDLDGSGTVDVDDLNALVNLILAQ